MAANLHSRTETILRRLVRRDAAPALRKVLAKTRAEDVAAVMTHLTGTEMRRLYSIIEDVDFAAAVLANLPDDAVREVAGEMTGDHIVQLLEMMEPDDATDVVEVLPHELRDRVLRQLVHGDDDDVSSLLAWPSDSAGGIMSPEVFVLPQTATTGSAIKSIQQYSEDLPTFYYLYIVDASERLVGVVSLRSLLTHPEHTPLVSIMNSDVISVGPTQDQEEVARYVARYDLLAVPVIDESGRVLGLVTVDDVLDVIREEAAEDMMLMAGVHGGAGDALDHSGRSAVEMTRMRSGWLLATAFGGILADRIIHAFSGGLPVEVLAGLIPVVMGMGGNVGIQSTTLAVRGLATGSVQIGGAVPFIVREAKVGVMLGVLYGVLLGAYGLASGWPDPYVGMTVGIGVFLAIGIGSVLGSSLPVGLSRLGIDPAIATGPFVTTAVDILGIGVYFGVAHLLFPA
ncbi:MAG: magnesium transporter [Proteobacteria bacterium]|nr:magnesium transporter [Pseudomonadota bacterium]